MRPNAFPYKLTRATSVTYLTIHQADLNFEGSALSPFSDVTQDDKRGLIAYDSL